MPSARICFGLVALLALAGAMPSAVAASLRPAPMPAMTRASVTVVPTDISASRRHVGRVRHATRLHIYRRGDYSFFEPYAPPVPPFFPFGYHQGYF
jgi:hypothetical protein